MHIVFISIMEGAPWGGSEEMWTRAAARLHQAGHEVSATVNYWPPVSPKWTALAGEGVALRFRKSPMQISLAAKVWLKLQKCLGRPAQEWVWLRRQNPDLAVLSQGDNRGGLDWMKFCRDSHIPFVVIVQSNFEEWWPEDVRAGELVSAYQAARKVFFVSRKNLDLMERQLAVSLPNAEVIWNPCNVPTGDPPPWPQGDGVWKMACVGRLNPANKGHDVVFQTLAQPEWRQRPVELNLYGTGDWEQGLKNLARFLDLKNVKFHGQVSDVRRIWAENHLLLIGSRYEGLPLVLAEAMWCGRPAVVTDVGGNAELCVDGETGFVAAAPVRSLFSEALERAWSRRSEWPEMGRAGRARAGRLIPPDPVGDFCGQLTQIVAVPSPAASGRQPWLKEEVREAGTVS